MKDKMGRGALLRHNNYAKVQSDKTSNIVFKVTALTVHCNWVYMMSMTSVVTLKATLKINS